MKQMCKYALVQFMPFVETGEFANVGIIICAPKTGYWNFKLAPTQFGRVTTFFKEMDKKVYQTAIKSFTDEMFLTQEYAQVFRNEESVRFFTEITRPREALLRFSPVRTMISDNPEKELNALYDRFIHRDFVNEKYREDQMVSVLRKRLKAEVLDVKYAERKLKTGFREFTVPFVGDVNNELRLIKPLAFEQKRATDLYEHGEKWRNRLLGMVNEGSVKPENVLFPIEKERDLKGERKQAYEQVIHEFKENGIEVINFRDEEKIIEFANGNIH